jgi:hypothetical protein
VCSTKRTTLNKKTRKEIQIKFYEAVVVPTLINRSKIWTVTKKHKAKIETAEIKFLKSAARKDQIRNTKIKEELNIFNLNAKNHKIKITMGISCNEWKTGRF